MIALVTGGRTYTNREVVYTMLSMVHTRKPITLLVEGGAAGVDVLCRAWAIDNDVPFQTYAITKGDWERYGNRAGRRRNFQMLNEARPQVLIAFPGSKGTQHMTLLAMQAGLPIIDSRKFLQV